MAVRSATAAFGLLAALVAVLCVHDPSPQLGFDPVGEILGGSQRAAPYLDWVRGGTQALREAYPEQEEYALTALLGVFGVVLLYCQLSWYGVFQPRRPSYVMPFHTSVSAWRDHLEEQGFVVLSDVLSRRQCDTLWSMAWDTLEGLRNPDGTPYGISRHDPKTWSSKAWVKGPGSHGMLQSGCWGQIPMCWKAREWCAPVFERLYGERVITSMDGWCFRRPHHQRERGQWYHVDQHLEKPEFQSYQGFVTTRDITEMDACFGFFPESHLIFADLKRHLGLEVKDFQRFTDDQLAEIERRYGLSRTRVAMPAGSFVLWDSRGIHCGTPPTDPKLVPSDPFRGFRHVVYVCMVPLSWASSDDLAKRRQILEDRRTTGHHPTKAELFSKRFRWEESPQPSDDGVLTYAQLSSKQRSLLDGTSSALEWARWAAWLPLRLAQWVLWLVGWAARASAWLASGCTWPLKWVVRAAYRFVHRTFFWRPKWYQASAPCDCVVLFAGAGGTDDGYHVAGCPTKLVIECDPKMMALNAHNFPEAERYLIWIGDGDGKTTSVAEIANLIVRKVRAGKIKPGFHLHLSPPCQGVSAANRTASAARNAALNRLMLHSLELVARLKGHWGSWSIEQVPAGLKYMEMHCEWVRSVPRTVAKAGEFGAATLRKRVFVGEGWTLCPTHGRIGQPPYVATQDVLPHLRYPVTNEHGRGRIFVMNGARSGFDRKEGPQRRGVDVACFAPIASCSHHLVFKKDGSETYKNLRDMTPVELKKVQGFSAGYDLPDDDVTYSYFNTTDPRCPSQSTTERMNKTGHIKGVGNSVSAHVSNAMMRYRFVIDKKKSVVVGKWRVAAFSAKV